VRLLMPRLLLAFFIIAIFVINIRTWAFQGVPQFFSILTPTTTSQSADFGFSTKAILIINDGSGTVFFTLDTQIATIDDTELKTGETISISTLNPFDGMGYIGDATGTVIRVFAWK